VGDAPESRRTFVSGTAHGCGRCVLTTVCTELLRFTKPSGALPPFEINVLGLPVDAGDLRNGNNFHFKGFGDCSEGMNRYARAGGAAFLPGAADTPH
jgi:hypothetical protein